MLRNVLLIISIAVLASGVVCLLFKIAAPAYTLLMWGALLFAAVVYERFRYKPLEHGLPGPGWERTSERFVDAESGKTVTVYVEPKTGERQYVEE
ncbi:MAG TPA: hypothetical protein VHU23_04945 [Rhizomicrobium sp.]|jgi:hypothetical protein|nr:hypothetical protein [Rhizomicrobium sp.]